MSQESYDARNNYVGQYANLDDVSEIYLAMLDGWLHHLRTGQRYDVDYYEQCEDAEKMLAEIKQYYHINSVLVNLFPRVELKLFAKGDSFAI